MKRSDAVDVLAQHLGKSHADVASLLWDTYHPYQVWYAFAAVGLLSLVGMLVFTRMSKRWQELDV